jgi:hypothetical protein
VFRDRKRRSRYVEPIDKPKLREVLAWLQASAEYELTESMYRLGGLRSSAVALREFHAS